MQYSTNSRDSVLIRATAILASDTLVEAATVLVHLFVLQSGYYMERIAEFMYKNKKIFTK